MMQEKEGGGLMNPGKETCIFVYCGRFDTTLDGFTICLLVCESVMLTKSAN